MNKLAKIIAEILLLLAAVLLVVLIVRSIQEPVQFNKEKAAREQVAIQRLKDLRDLEVAYKSANGRFSDNIDTLKAFYEEGNLEVVLQIGSQDDSIAVARTAELKKQNKKLTNEDLYELYKKGESHLVFSISTKVPVKDTLFKNRTNFSVDSLGVIPFSGGEKVQIESIVKKVSGVDVPLFEARVPYKALLKGLDNQLRINLDAERENQNRYVGLQVGSISAPNNNAGNWE